MNERDKLIKTKKNNKRIDEIKKQIQDEIIANYYYYPVDFILETWTRFGASPNLVYDDDGLFAISNIGYPAVYGKQKMEGEIIVLIKKNQWKESIREALKIYIGA